MSLLREIMDDAIEVVTDVLGSPCTLTNGLDETTLTADVIIRHEVELYQQGMFAGLVSTATISRVAASPLIGDTIEDHATGFIYSLDGIKSETPSKVEFVIGQQ
jgi:hypothetical protein